MFFLSEYKKDIKIIIGYFKGCIKKGCQDFLILKASSFVFGSLRMLGDTMLSRIR